MRSHFDAIKALIAGLSLPVYIIDVPAKPTYPYVLLWGLPGLPERVEDDSLQAEQGTYSDLLRVTTVGATAESTLEKRRIVRALLLGSRPVVTGRVVHELRLFDATDVMVDRDVTIPDTSRHPTYGVDIFRLVSEPAAAVPEPTPEEG